MAYYVNTHAYKMTNVKPTYRYARIIRFLQNHKGEEFTRKELLLKSGYWDTDSKDFDWLKASPNSVSRCQNNGLTSKLRALGIANYNPHTQRWSSGENVDNYNV